MTALGRVVAFDEAAGLGEVEAADGARHRFHCTQLTDGTRTVAVGTVVAYVLRPWHAGRWEATALTSVAAVAAAAPAAVPAERAG